MPPPLPPPLPPLPPPPGCPGLSAMAGLGGPTSAPLSSRDHFSQPGNAPIPSHLCRLVLAPSQALGYLRPSVPPPAPPPLARRCSRAVATTARTPWDRGTSRANWAAEAHSSADFWRTVANRERDFMSFWRLPRRPSPIAVRPAAARARQGLPPLPPPAVARARRDAPRPHGRLPVGRSWRSLSDLELSKERSQIA